MVYTHGKAWASVATLTTQQARIARAASEAKQLGMECTRKGRWLRVQPHSPHAVSEVLAGTWWSVVFGCVGQLDKVADGVWGSLSQLKFPVLNMRREAKRVRQHIAGELGVAEGNYVLFRPPVLNMRREGKRVRQHIAGELGVAEENHVLFRPC
eukprot:5812916-Amphidinium_carterae.2